MPKDTRPGMTMMIQEATRHKSRHDDGVRMFHQMPKDTRPDMRMVLQDATRHKTRHEDDVRM